MTRYKVAIVRYEKPLTSVKQVVELADGLGHLPSRAKVFIKPNIAYWTRAVIFPKWGVVTTSRVVEDMVVLLKEQGVDDITIGEGMITLDPKDRATPAHAFETLGYQDLKKRYGVKYLNVFERPFEKLDLGDGVNLAARLESACKKYSSRILISENTFKKLHGTYRIRDIDDVVVKGKSEAVRIYEVLDYHTDESFPSLMEVVSHFKEGRNHYSKGNWEKAVKSFQRALELHPDDKLSNIYIERCQHLQENPPPSDWDGVWVMQTK